jgi:hypothetical protein
VDARVHLPEYPHADPTLINSNLQNSELTQTRRGSFTAMQLYTNSGQTTGAPLLIKVKDVQSTRTMIEELIKLQFEVISFSKFITDLFFAFDSNIGRFIYVEQRFS